MTARKGMLTAEERAFYSSETAEQNRHQIRIDPNRPGFIRADEDDAADEFEEDVGLSKAGAKRKHVRTDVDGSLVSQLMHQTGLQQRLLPRRHLQEEKIQQARETRPS